MEVVKLVQKARKDKSEDSIDGVDTHKKHPIVSESNWEEQRKEVIKVLV